MKNLCADSSKLRFSPCSYAHQLYELIVRRTLQRFKLLQTTICVSEPRPVRLGGLHLHKVT